MRPHPPTTRPVLNREKSGHAMPATPWPFALLWPPSLSASPWPGPPSGIRLHSTTLLDFSFLFMECPKTAALWVLCYMLPVLYVNI